MKVGMWRRTLKNIITGREYCRKNNWKENKKRQRLLKCSQTSLLPLFSGDLQFHLMDNYLFFPVEYGETVRLMILIVAHICLEKTTSQNLLSPFKPTNNQFSSASFVLFCLRKPIPKRECSNNLITWFLRLPLPTVFLFTAQTIWNHCMVWVISTMLL